MNDKFDNNTQEQINNFITSFNNVFKGIATKETLQKKINNNLNYNIEYSDSLSCDFEYNPYLKILVINSKNIEKEEQILFKAFTKIIMTNIEKGQVTSGFEIIEVNSVTNKNINDVFLELIGREYNKYMKQDIIENSILNIMEIIFPKNILKEYLINSNILQNKIENIKVLNQLLEELENIRQTSSDIYQKRGELENVILDLYDPNDKNDDLVLKELNALIENMKNPNLDKFYTIINQNIHDKNLLKKYPILFKAYETVKLANDNKLELIIKNYKDYLSSELYVLRKILNINNDDFIIQKNNYNSELFSYNSMYLDILNKKSSYEFYDKYQIYHQLINLIDIGYLKISDIDKINIYYNDFIDYEIDSSSNQESYIIKNEFANNYILIENENKNTIIKFDDKSTCIYEKRDVLDLQGIYNLEYINNLIDKNVEVFYNEDMDNYIFYNNKKIINPNDIEGNIVLNTSLVLLNNLKNNSKK
ncbi:MAG: hypothetical protein ACI4OT_04800 [Bacilli bacterium]